MKRTLLLSVVATTLLAAGCARQQPESPPVAAPDRIGSCSVADTKPTMQSAKPIHASVDLDHDGVGDAVKVTLPGSACPHLMFTRLGDGRVISLDLGTVELSLGTGRRVVVPKRDGDLLAGVLSTTIGAPGPCVSGTTLWLPMRVSARLT